MSKYARRRDANHSIIVRQFETLGAVVMDTSNLGDGFPDLVVCHRGQKHFVEIKTAKGTLTRPQELFIENCTNHKIEVHVVRDIADVMKVLDVTAF